MGRNFFSLEQKSKCQESYSIDLDTVYNSLINDLLFSFSFAFLYFPLTLNLTQELLLSRVILLDGMSDNLRRELRNNFFLLLFECFQIISIQQ